MAISNKRRYVRTKMRADVKLLHPDAGEFSLKTGDISDGGAFILTDGQPPLAVGDVVTVQVQGMGSGDAPNVKMRIVRMDKEGLGMEFIQDD